MSHCPNLNATCNAFAAASHGPLTEFQSMILLVGITTLAIFFIGKFEGDTDSDDPAHLNSLRNIADLPLHIGYYFLTGKSTKLLETAFPRLKKDYGRGRPER